MHRALEEENEDRAQPTDVGGRVLEAEVDVCNKQLPVTRCHIFLAAILFYLLINKPRSTLSPDHTVDKAPIRLHPLGNLCRVVIPQLDAIECKRVN